MPSRTARGVLVLAASAAILIAWFGANMRSIAAGPANSPDRRAAEALRVAAAASLTDVLTPIAADFKAETGIDVQPVFGASGQLAGQIRGGAPIDVFIPAAQTQIDELEKGGFVMVGSRRVVALNALVLIAPAQGDAPAGFEALAEPAVKRIAIGETSTVPAGQYAMEVLEHFGLAQRVRSKLIFAANVRQVLAYVESGDAGAGIVYSTDAKIGGTRIRTIATADPAWHKAIEYPAVIIAASRQQAAAKRFLEHLTSEKSRAQFSAQGFSLPPPPASQPAPATAPSRPPATQPASQPASRPGKPDGSGH